MPKLIIHVPHASTHIPPDVWADFSMHRDAVEREAEASADLYTDIMAKQAWPTATIVEAKVSRIVVDVERYDDDEKEEMSQVGRGVLYTVDRQMRNMRRPVSPERREDLLARYYRPHWEQLRSLSAGAVLIDLHTYPAEPWAIERSAENARPEIDVGFSEGLTPPNWVEELTKHFRRQGYEVGHNTPYAGVIDAGATAAVMLEIRRDMVGTPGQAQEWRRLIDALCSMSLVA
jgi:N-formylglutamate deformylase